MVRWHPNRSKSSKPLELQAIQLSFGVGIGAFVQLGKRLASNKSLLLAVIASTIQENLMGI